LEESIARLECRRFAEPLSDAQGRKVLIADKKGREYFELSTRAFFSRFKKGAKDGSNLNPASLRAETL
jgi:hypothetical protein